VTVAAAYSTELARARGLAERTALPWIDLDAESIDPRAVDELPLDLLRSALALPYGFGESGLKVALADPSARQRISEHVASPVEFAVAPRASIMNLLGSLEQTRRSGGGPLLAVETAGDAETSEPELALLKRAAEAGATDVHFVPCEAGLFVRARIDGLLRQIGRVDAVVAQPTVSRLKVQSRLDISEHRRSQEGRMTIASGGGRQFDLRLTTLPTVAGEGVAVRILERATRPPTLTEIGLSPDVQLQLERIVNDQRGTLLVTGPTGSGKSTTIFAALADLARPELNIVTVEDPVEYRLDGVYQIEINPDAGVTFDSALRSILRTDPDVVAVGEMRDLGTASTALKAALSGSFVLSTLHTTDAPAAITRLLDIGVEPYVTAATVTAVLAQRLVRRLCIYCRERYTPTPVELRELGIEQTDCYLFRAQGCPHCDRGYRGQIGIHQLMLMSDELRQLTIARARREEIAQVAHAGSMRTLWEDGVAKALAGITTVDEIRRTAE
jgi:type II secretory ATPase GspE/PulE/Tfp pilus assembly ATPase PilB-like protein